jgi:hypothetical protein
MATFNLRIPALDSMSNADSSFQWMAVESFGLRNLSGEMVSGLKTGTGTGRDVPKTAVIVKRLDKYSPGLLNLSQNGRQLDEAVVHIAGLPIGSAVAIALMKKVFVDSVHWANTGDNEPGEILELSIGEFQYMPLSQYLGLKGAKVPG